MVSVLCLLMILAQSVCGMLFSGECVLGPLAREEHTDRVSSVSFSRDGQRIVSGSWDRTVRVCGMLYLGSAYWGH